MKAYQINIELLGSNPLIWRRVIMPAGATFNRLHDVIQQVTNFKDYHLFSFDLPEENIRVTNDEQAYEEHKDFMKNQKSIEEKIRHNTTPETKRFAEAQIRNLNTVIRKPTGIKIDAYLEKYGELSYTYDFGDNWEFLITLEQVVDGYKYGHPTLIAGAETAPPEDVGNIPGYEEFLAIYQDENHPSHEDMKEWANEQLYKEFDKVFINNMLKFIKYKKNEQ